MLVPGEFEEIRTFDFDGLVNIKLAVHSYVGVKRYLLPNICFQKFAISIAHHNSTRPFFSKENFLEAMWLFTTLFLASSAAGND